MFFYRYGVRIPYLISTEPFMIICSPTIGVPLLPSSASLLPSEFAPGPFAPPQPPSPPAALRGFPVDTFIKTFSAVIPLPPFPPSPP